MSEQPGTTPTIEKMGHAIVARLQKKMADDSEFKTINRQIDEAVAADPNITLVVLDLTKVYLIPSMALGLLVQISNKCKARQQALKFAGVQPTVRQVFSITRLDKTFQFATTVEAALQ